MACRPAVSRNRGFFQKRSKRWRQIISNRFARSSLADLTIYWGGPSVDSLPTPSPPYSRTKATKLLSLHCSTLTQPAPKELRHPNILSRSKLTVAGEEYFRTVNVRPCRRS